MKLLLLIILSVHRLRAQEDTNLCTSQYCVEFLEQSNCAPLPDNCKIQNSTHNGIFLPSPDSCNCCEYCLANLGEGDACAIGEPGGLIPDSICGPGLTCDAGICKPITNTPCTLALADYNQRRADGTLGALEVPPNCDGDGDYEPYRCIPGQTCFCVDKAGNRIFGEIPFTNTAPFVLKCPCSRKYHDAVSVIGKDLHPNQFFRCTDTGDYDSIQCLDDGCFCTDAGDGAPTFPAAAPVPIADLNEDAMPENCFKSGWHKEGAYYFDCAEKYLGILKEYNAYVEDGYEAVFNFRFPSCSLEGKYAPVQISGDKAFCALADSGEPMEDYIVDVSESQGMDCKCARTKLLLPDSLLEQPECCPNGNFKKLQCRRGSCRCVDSDGYQIVKEVEEERQNELPCYEAPCDFST